MRSTERDRRAQRGASLVESVVASALLGIGVVAGLTAWDTASMSANKAIRLAWAHCIVRAELDALLSAPYDSEYDQQPTYPSPPPYVHIHLLHVRGLSDSSPDAEQQITVDATDPADTSVVVAQATALKARALAGGKPLPNVGNDVLLGCPPR
jgi:Tfp pilus assembly protein PilV